MFSDQGLDFQLYKKIITKYGIRCRLIWQAAGQKKVDGRGLIMLIELAGVKLVLQNNDSNFCIPSKPSDWSFLNFDPFMKRRNFSWLFYFSSKIRDRIFKNKSLFFQEKCHLTFLAHFWGGRLKITFFKISLRQQQRERYGMGDRYLCTTYLSTYLFISYAPSYLPPNLQDCLGLVKNKVLKLHFMLHPVCKPQINF